MEKIFDRNIGDSVWVMNNNKAVNGKVCSLHYCKFISNVDFETIIESEHIGVALPNSCEDFEPKYVFSTKEDLLNSL